MATAIAEISERITIKKFMKSKGFSSFFKSIRVNSNNYPYVTFLRPLPDGRNEGENVYFSKNFSDHVAEGVDVLSLFKSGNVKVAQISYRDGRPTRWKLVSSESGDYVSIDDLD